MSEFRVESLGAEGRGVAHGPDGKVVFVEGGLPGEHVEARIISGRKRYDVAQLTAVQEPSGNRRVPPCPHFGVCGGCLLQHAQMRMQVAAKQRWLEDALYRIGRVTPATMLPPVYGSEWGYRRRARFSVYWVASEDRLRIGFRERNSSHVANLGTCLVLPEKVSQLLPSLARLIGSLGIRARIPQIEIAVGDRATALVLRHLEPVDARDRERLEAFVLPAGMQFWLQAAGPESVHPLREAQVLDYALPEFAVTIAFGPTDFTQVNHEVNRILVARTVGLIGAVPGERVLDLFCGLGNFSLPLARSGAAVLGIEGNRGMVEKARMNAEANGLGGSAQFECVDLRQMTGETLAQYGRFDKVLLDPPREGAMEVLRALAGRAVRRIVYVSCDPATLARDAGMLVHSMGYELSMAGVINMFPHTAHVESIAVFDRLN